MEIHITTIPHKSQMYETIGDWIFDEKGNLDITVSELGDWRYEMLVGIHEAIEALLCKHREIDEKEITAFDMQFEADRKLFEWGNDSEPGDDRFAPYVDEHFFATTIERLLATELDVVWSEYEEITMDI